MCIRDRCTYSFSDRDDTVATNFGYLNSYLIGVFLNSVTNKDISDSERLGKVAAMCLFIFCIVFVLCLFAVSMFVGESKYVGMYFWCRRPEKERISVCEVQCTV